MSATPINVSSFLANVRSVGTAVFDHPVKKQGRTLSPDMVALIDLIKTIKDDKVVYEIPLDPVVDETDEDLKKRVAALRQMLARASKYADVKIAVRRSESGFYVGLLTADRQWHRKNTPAA
jgi:hypothetical protein